MVEVLDIFLQVAPLVIGLFIGIVPGWVILKEKIHQMTEFFIAIDEALYDDAVSEAEFRKIFDKGFALFGGSFAKKKRK